MLSSPGFINISAWWNPVKSQSFLAKSSDCGSQVALNLFQGIFEERLQPDVISTMAFMTSYHGVFLRIYRGEAWTIGGFTNNHLLKGLVELGKSELRKPWISPQHIEMSCKSNVHLCAIQWRWSFWDFYASVGSWLLPFNSHENWWFDHQLLGAFYCVWDQQPDLGIFPWAAQPR